MRGPALDRLRFGVVDGDARFGAGLVSRLAAAGVAAELHPDAARLIGLLGSRPPSLVVLGEGGGTGPDAALDALRRIRALSRVPCVVLGERADPEQSVGFLEAGADDLMTRCTPVETMLARMRAVLRRGAWGLTADPPGAADAEPSAAPPGWRLLRMRRELFRPDGSDCRLTTAEFDLFCLLVDRGPVPVSREDICSAVFRRRWRAEDRTADNLVVRLRRKLDDPARTTIRTVQGQGYSFVGFPDATLREG